MRVRYKQIGFLVLFALFLTLIPISLVTPQAQPTKPAAPPQAAQIKLRFNGIHPPMALPSKAWKFWMDKVAEKTNGRITFEAYWSGQLISIAELIDGISKGVAETGSGAWIFHPGKLPLGNFELNFLFNDPDYRKEARIKRQMFDEIPALNAELAKYNLAPAIYFAPTSGFNLLTKKPVKTMADLKGMRIAHTPAEHVQLYKTAGAASVIAPAPEFYSMLERGLVDGVSLPIDIQSIYKLQEVAKHYTTVNIGVTVIFTTFINGGTWKKLSPEDQQIFKEAARETEIYYLAELDKLIATYRKAHQDAGVQFYTMPVEEVKKWAAACPDITAEWAKKMEANGLPGWQIVDKYIELLRNEGWEFPRKWGVR